MRPALRAPAPPRERPLPRKKDTRSFCRGKPGRQHSLVTRREERPFSGEALIRVCTACGKTVARWWPPRPMRVLERDGTVREDWRFVDTREPPAWVRECS